MTRGRTRGEEVVKKECVLTMAEAEEEMRCYRKVFNVVRILHKDEIGGICTREDTEKLNCPCYSFWGTQRPCDNCISARAYQSKKDEVKLEFSKDGVYQAIARYAEIDGVPCVMELLREFDSEAFLDLSGEEKLLSRLNGYYEKTYTDVLTGVYNRRFYEEKLKNSVFAAAGVAMIDLDDFKVYNDVYGHIAGDAVLSSFAAALKKDIRTSDKLVRYGGDEFLLIMPGLQSDHFDSVLNHILQRVSNIVMRGYAEINLTSSIGATVCANETVENAVNRADRLLYRAKTKKNAIVTDNGAEISEEQNKASVLIADDSEADRSVLFSILGNEYNVLEADDGKACVEALAEYGSGIALVLLDIMMPDADGFTVLKYMADNHYIEDVPVIAVTDDESPGALRRAYEMGVSDFIARPFDAKVVYRRVSNTINLHEKQRRLISAVLDEMLEKEKNSHILVDILSQVTEFRSGMGREHITNINIITELLLAKLMDKTDRYALTKKDVYLIATASALHDIGKVEINRDILNKPGKLTPEEFEEVKKHTVLGAEIVMNIHEYHNEPLVKYAYQICLYHHEKYDGKGYPKGLKGEEIPIAAQVVSLADVYDALTAKRVYKAAYSSDEALKMILNGECGKFNPLLLECLLDIKDLLVKDANGEIR